MSENKDDIKVDNFIRNAGVDIDGFFEIFSKETDRGMAIASVCFLDEILEKLLRAAYRKDKRIKILFGSNQILHSYYNKVHIAYFSGLVPEAIFEDMKIVGEIRNKFAHFVLDVASFDDEVIVGKINTFKLLPQDYKTLYSPRLLFMLVVVHMGSLMLGFKEGLSLSKLKTIRFDMDIETLQGLILSPQEIRELKKKQPE